MSVKSLTPKMFTDILDAKNVHCPMSSKMLPSLCGDLSFKRGGM